MGTGKIQGAIIRLGRPILFFVTLVALLAAAIPASADTVLSFAEFNATTFSPGMASADSPLITSFTSGSINEPGNGTTSSTVTYNVMPDEFDSSYTQSRDGTRGFEAEGDANYSFHVTTATAYNVTGTYSVTDVGAGGNGVEFDVKLTDFTADPSGHDVVYESLQVSSSTHNASFTVGGMAGDTTNVLTGSASGMLIANHTYHLNITADTVANSADSGASASGFADFSLGGAEVTPLPPTAWAGLVLMGVLGITQIVRNRRKNPADGERVEAACRIPTPHCASGEISQAPWCG